MHIEERTLDVNKYDRGCRIKPIVLRRGETGETQIKVNLTSDGEPYSESGMKANFCAYLPNREYVKTAANVSGSVVTYTVDNKLTTTEGDIRIAYIELTVNNKIITSDNMIIVIMRDVDMTLGEAKAYQNRIDSILAQLDIDLSTINGAVGNADKKYSEFMDALSKALKDIDNAASIAKEAEATAKTAKATIDDAMAAYRTITGTEVHYGVSDTQSVQPTSWSTSQPTIAKGKWLWTRTTFHYSQGADTVEYSKAYSGYDGNFEASGRLDDFENRLGAINDYTTGINLLRGTRDFVSGITPYLAGKNYLKDGWFWNNAKITTYKDDDGFTVLNFKQDGLDANNIVIAYSSISNGHSANEVMTVSCEFMIDDVEEFTTFVTTLIRCDVFPNDGGNSKGGVNFSYGGGTGGNTNYESGKWYKWVYTFSTSLIESEDDWVLFSPRLNRNGSLNVRKLKVERGKVNNPIWSSSPFDVAQASDVSPMRLSDLDDVICVLYESTVAQSEVISQQDDALCEVYELIGEINE